MYLFIVGLSSPSRPTICPPLSPPPPPPHLLLLLLLPPTHHHQALFFLQVNTSSTQLAMKLLLPNRDQQRPAAYRMKEVALAKQYIDVLNIAKECSNTQKLLHYSITGSTCWQTGET